ncbi:MAG: radical SAM protein [Rickettsiales bacterium]|nr:radical SAM protein [Rickettsiales bacterium]
MKFESGVELISMGNNIFCLNHSLRQQQIFGSKILSDAFNSIKESGSYSDNNIINEFKKNGFLIEDEKDPDYLFNFLREYEDKNCDTNPSFNLLRILLTDICNLNCDYCKVIKLIDAPQTKPTDRKRLEDVIKFFFENSEENKPKIIHITGGEPTIFFDDIKNIIALKNKYARKNENCWCVIGTNAVLINDEKAKFLADNNIKCIVSMDGKKEIHNLLRKTCNDEGSWDLVDRGIKLLKKHGCEVSISAVMGKHTINNPQDTIDFIIENYKPTGLGINFMKPPNPNQTDYEYLITPEDFANNIYKLHKNFRKQGIFIESVYRHLYPFVKRKFRFHDCGAAGSNNLNIDAKGNIGGCKSFLLMNKLALNSLSVEEYKKTITSKWRKRSPIYYPCCKNCPAIGICGNGCAYDAFTHEKDEMAIDYRSCGYTKIFFNLFLQDLLSFIKPENVSDNWFYVIKQEDRDKLLGNVKVIENSLSYSVGHQTDYYNKTLDEILQKLK